MTHLDITLRSILFSLLFYNPYLVLAVNCEQIMRLKFINYMIRNKEKIVKNILMVELNRGSRDLAVSTEEPMFSREKNPLLSAHEDMFRQIQSTSFRGIFTISISNYFSNFLVSVGIRNFWLHQS